MQVFKKNVSDFHLKTFLENRVQFFPLHQYVTTLKFVWKKNPVVCVLLKDHLLHILHYVFWPWSALQLHLVNLLERQALKYDKLSLFVACEIVLWSFCSDRLWYLFLQTSGQLKTYVPLNKTLKKHPLCVRAWEQQKEDGVNFKQFKRLWHWFTHTFLCKRSLCEEALSHIGHTIHQC